MTYTISEIAQMLGVAPSTLRYYDKEGLLPPIKRSPGGNRVFEQQDYEWLLIIECLKKAGMQLCHNMVEVDKRIIEILQQHEIDRPTEIRNRVGWIDTDKSRIIGYRIEMRQSLIFYPSHLVVRGVFA